MTDSAPIFVNVAWGEVYVDLMMDVCISSLLSENNLPVFAGTDAVYSIYTSAKDRGRIQSHPNYQRLKQVMQVVVNVAGNDLSGVHKYDFLTGCHNHALAEGFEHNRPVIFLYPDGCWSDGSMKTVKKSIENGKRALMISAPRIAKETFLPEMETRFPADENGARTMAARELVNCGLDHLHPYTQSLYWDSPDFNKYIAHYYFDVPGDGVLARYFILHPLMVWPKRLSNHLTRTIDVQLMNEAFDSYDELDIIRDSDDLFAVELSPRNRPDPNYYIKKDGSLLLWSKHQDKRLPDDVDMKAITAAIHCKFNYDTPFHRKFMNEDIRYHTGAKPDAWEDVIERADKVTEVVSDWMDKDAAGLFSTFCNQNFEGEVLAGAGPRY